MPESSYNISNEDTIRRLRSKGQPIRLFGETDKDRRLRLRALELIEEKDHDKQGGQNDFKKALEDVENIERELRSRNTKGKKREDHDPSTDSVLDLGLIKTDPDKLYPIIYYALKRTLKEWGEAMDERPGTPIASWCTDGMILTGNRECEAYYPGETGRCHSSAVSRILETALQITTLKGTFLSSLTDMFLLTNAQSLPADVLARMAEIVHYMQKRQYQKANDSYLRLSIGNAPWPIGVTMVG